MVSNRHRMSRPAPIWRGSQIHGRTQSRRQLPTYSHINIQPAVVNEERVNSTLTEDFVRRLSIQEEIDASLFHVARTFSTTAPSALPRTFAEAAMSTRRGGPNTNEGNSHPSLAFPTSLESQDSNKYTFKKKKKAAKWAPFDLGAADSTSEGGSLSESASLSRAASPTPVILTSTSATKTALPPMAASTSDSSPTTTAIFPTLGEAPSTPDWVNAQSVRTGVARLPSAADPSSLPDKGDQALVQGSDPVLTATSDSDLGAKSQAQSHIDDTMANSIMSIDAGKYKENGDNIFDYLKWNPELPLSSAAPKSHEPSPTAAQPVTYTTVGSIVDPKAAPQFTAPNRIQREGSGRRHLPQIQNRQYDSNYMYRAHSPHMATGLHHAHLPIHSPSCFDLSYPSNLNLPQSTLFTHPVQQNYQLTDHETSLLTNLHDSNAANIFDISSQNSLVAVPPPDYSMGPTNVTHLTYSFGDMMDEEAQRHHISTQGLGQATGSIQGLEKMQTLQRLAKFENPMQSLALSRLSEFSVSKSNVPSITPADARLGEDDLRRGDENDTLATLPKAGAGGQQPGELNRAYRFPLSAAVDSPKPQANPLFGAFSPSTTRTSNDPSRALSGYPAPLTAGPPGQRQYQGSMNRAQVVHPDGNWRVGPQISTFNPYAGGTSTKSSSAPSEEQDTQCMPPYIFQSIIPSHNRRKCKSSMADTLDIPVISKYYPRGMPPDMNANICSLPSNIRRELDVVSGDALPETTAEIAARRAKDLEHWFYDGQRRYAGMSGADHIKEYEDRLLESVNPFGPTGRRRKEPYSPIQNDPLAAEDINKISMAEAAGPLLNAGFGALLTYLTPTDAPETARVLSRFAPSPAWFLDESDAGNKSFYETNVPPMKNGGDAQYS